MIWLEEKKIIQADKSEDIKEFVVWFRSPMGLHTTFNEAYETCAKLEIDIQNGIRPTVVVKGETLFEEML